MQTAAGGTRMQQTCCCSTFCLFGSRDLSSCFPFAPPVQERKASAETRSHHDKETCDRRSSDGPFLKGDVSSLIRTKKKKGRRVFSSHAGQRMHEDKRPFPFFFPSGGQASGGLVNAELSILKLKPSLVFAEAEFDFGTQRIMWSCFPRRVLQACCRVMLSTCMVFSFL